MCGRFSLISSGKQVMAVFDTTNSLEYKHRYNIAPSTDSLIIKLDNGERVQALHNWGFMPHWAKPDTIIRPINARAETVREKPFFRAAFQNRRCLVVANGYYEWKGDKGKKQPYYIRPIGTYLIAFAGLWDTWEGPEEELKTFTIIVTKANKTTKQIHNRMPVILDRNDYDQWLEKGGTKLLAPYRDDRLECYKVSTLVNKPKNEGGKLIKSL